MSGRDELRELERRQNGNGSPSARQLVLTTIATVEPEPVRWLWRGRVVLGMLNVTVGEPGLGKSTLSYDLAAKLSLGELDGDLYAIPVDVLVVTYEDHIASVVRPRLEAAGADLERVHECGIKETDGSEGLLTLPGDIELIRQAIESTHARVLIVDPIVASLGGEINSHRDQDVRRVLAPLAQLAERYDVAVIVVMHVNKSQAKEFLRRVGGSVGFTGAARSMLLVARDPNDPDGERGSRRVLAHGKCNVAALAPSLLFEIESVRLAERDIETSRLRFHGECETTTAELLGGDSTDERLEIVEAIEFLEGELENGRRPEVEIRESATAQGISDATLRRARKQRGVKSEREGFGSAGRWYLALPDGAAHRRSPADGAGAMNAYGEALDLQGKTGLEKAPQAHRRSPVEVERLWAGEGGTPTLNGSDLPPVAPGGFGGYGGDERPVADLTDGELLIVFPGSSFVSQDTSGWLSCDCAYPTRHREHREPHPVTDRPVCQVCHPVPGATA